MLSLSIKTEFVRRLSLTFIKNKKTMKSYVFLFFSILLFGCKTNKEIISKKVIDQPFYVGTYTKGESEGIYKYVLKKDGTLSKIGLAAKTDNPTFLTLSSDKKYLLACQTNPKRKPSAVKSYSLRGDSLTLINSSSTGGIRPCYVSSNKLGYVLSANYYSGNIALHKLNDKGKLSNLLFNQQHYGKGITDRQKAPHAHSVYFDSTGLQVIAVDLGTDELWFSKLDTVQQILIPSKPYKMAMAPGAGPRHLTFHPSKKWIYVVNELDCTVTLLQKNSKGKYEKGASISTLPKNYTGKNTCADIHTSSDGKFVYVSNRGHNSIAIFKANPNNGLLKLIKLESVRGNWPRNFSLSPNNEFLLVANQFSNNIVSFKRDKKTGLLTFLDQIKAPTPVCILFK